MNIFEKVESQQYYLIAEIGVNYYDIAEQKNIGILDAAKLMIDEAIDAGIDCVKFQTYKAEKLASKYSPSYWDTSEEPMNSQYELFKKFDKFGFNEYVILSNYCKTKGVDFISTPFDFESADYLETLMPVYKISSSDITNIPFIRYIARKKKPILLSTGASNIDEIKNAVSAIENEGVKDIIIMHCVLEYPTPYQHANIDMVSALKNQFPNNMIGYSDHTKPDESMDVIKTAWLLGATILEKHFTLDKTLKGNDHYHAMDTEDIRKIKQGLEFIKGIKGSYDKKCLHTELPARLNARRSIVANTDIKAGTIINESMITFKRPGIGISPSELNRVIGKTTAIDILEDTILQYNMLK